MLVRVERSSVDRRPTPIFWMVLEKQYHSQADNAYCGIFAQCYLLTPHLFQMML